MVHEYWFIGYDDIKIHLENLIFTGLLLAKIWNPAERLATSEMYHTIKNED